MGSYLQDGEPFLFGEVYSLDRCPLMGTSRVRSHSVKSIDYHSKPATEVYPSSTFLIVLAISLFVSGFMANALMPAVVALSVSTR
jgi:hypothetical protein